MAPGRASGVLLSGRAGALFLLRWWMAVRRAREWLTGWRWRAAPRPPPTTRAPGHRRAGWGRGVGGGGEMGAVA